MFLHILSISSLQVNQYAGVSWKIKCLSSAGKWLGCWYPLFSSVLIFIVDSSDSTKKLVIPWCEGWRKHWSCDYQVTTYTLLTLYVYLLLMSVVLCLLGHPGSWCQYEYAVEKLYLLWLPKVSQWSLLQWCCSVMSHSPAGLSQQWTLGMYQYIVLQ